MVSQLGPSFCHWPKIITLLVVLKKKKTNNNNFNWQIWIFTFSTDFPNGQIKYQANFKQSLPKMSKIVKKKNPMMFKKNDNYE